MTRPIHHAHGLGAPVNHARWAAVAPVAARRRASGTAASLAVGAAARSAHVPAGAATASQLSPKAATVAIAYVDEGRSSCLPEKRARCWRCRARRNLLDRAERLLAGRSNVDGGYGPCGDSRYVVRGEPLRRIDDRTDRPLGSSGKVISDLA